MALLRLDVLATGQRGRGILAARGFSAGDRLCIFSHYTPRRSTPNRWRRGSGRPLAAKRCRCLLPLSLPTARRRRPPLCFIAVEGETLVGTVGLWRCDLISRQDLFPWMAALYVSPDARGRGIAGQLQQHVIDYARRLGHPQLYLYSACRDFYERFGWQYIGEGLDYPATAVSLYRYDLSLSDGAITE